MAFQPQMEPYVYKALGKGEIRLLELHPNTSGQQLSGSIIHIALAHPIYRPATACTEAYLEHQHAYEAISYTWGTDTTTPHSLIVDKNQTIGVTAHLQSVLQKIVQPDTTVLVWIDAICINQADRDSEEKAQQIRLMPDIYRIAKSVQIHLGLEADNSPLAIRFLEHVAEYAEYLDESLNIPNAQPYELAQARGFKLPEDQDETWSAVRLFWMRPWFRRVWVVQELVHATDIAMHCGDLEIDWRKLWIAARVFQNNQRLIMTSSTPFNVAIEALEGASSFFTMADVRLRAWGYMSYQYVIMSITRDERAAAVELVEKGLRPRETVPLRRDWTALMDNERLVKAKVLQDRAAGIALSFERQSIIAVLHLTRTFLATNPVDRIYAVLGLAGDIDVNDPDFRIEYSAQQTCQVVCQRFAAGLIKRGHGAAVLALAGTTAQARRTASDSPSWVPDWTTPVRPDAAIAPMNFLMHTLREHTEKQTLYCAAGTSTMNVSFEDNDCTLVIGGARIDTVSYLMQGELLAPPSLYETLVLQFRGPDANPTDVESDVWRTLVANRTFDGHEPPPEYAAQYRIYRQRLLHGVCIVVFLLILLFLTSLPLLILLAKRVSLKCLLLLYTLAFCLGYDAAPWLTIITTLLLRNSSLLAVAIGCSILAFRTRHLAFTYLLSLNREWSVFTGAVMAYNTAGVKTFNGPPDCAEFLQSLLALTGRYHLGVTEKGRVGLFPLATRKGDEVVVLKGGHAPFLIRQTEEDGCFELIGESYVHGVMKGEVFADEVECALEEIRLV